MTLPTKEDLLKEIIKQEKIFSIQLKFDNLIEKGVVERKKGTNGHTPFLNLTNSRWKLYHQI